MPDAPDQTLIPCYCTLDDLKTAIPVRTLVELSNDDPEATEINETIILRAITDATELVDGYLRGRYILPLNPIPTIVRNLTVDIARHWLYARRPEGYDFPEAVTRTYKTAINTLVTIQSGRITLGVPETGRDMPEPGEFIVSRRTPIFSDDVWERY